MIVYQVQYPYLAMHGLNLDKIGHGFVGTQSSIKVNLAVKVSWLWLQLNGFSKKCQHLCREFSKCLFDFFQKYFVIDGVVLSSIFSCIKYIMQGITLIDTKVSSHIKAIINRGLSVPLHRFLIQEETVNLLWVSYMKLIL